MQKDSCERIDKVSGQIPHRLGSETGRKPKQQAGSIPERPRESRAEKGLPRYHSSTETRALEDCHGLTEWLCYVTEQALTPSRDKVKVIASWA
jgi:hypothetical protein